MRCIRGANESVVRDVELQHSRFVRDVASSLLPFSHVHLGNSSETEQASYLEGPTFTRMAQQHHR